MMSELNGSSIKTLSIFTELGFLCSQSQEKVVHCKNKISGCLIGNEDIIQNLSWFVDGYDFIQQVELCVRTHTYNKPLCPSVLMEFTTKLIKFLFVKNVL